MRVDNEYNQSYTLFMKTAISIPDEVFVAAEGLAERLGMSRSQLYSSAIAQYVTAYRSKGVTARLNGVYQTEQGEMDPAVLELQGVSLPTEEW
nr:putative integron gene cassette protein [uncultured bacterium]